MTFMTATMFAFRAKLVAGFTENGAKMFNRLNG